MDTYSIIDPEEDRIMADREQNPDGRNLREDTEAWIEANPAAYAQLAILAMRLVERGHSRIGIKMIFETARYNWTLQNDPGEHDPRFLLNNNWSAYVARKLAADYPALRDAFEFRKTRY